MAAEATIVHQLKFTYQASDIDVLPLMIALNHGTGIDLSFPTTKGAWKKFIHAASPTQ
jgi:hypothetical protein